MAAEAYCVKCRAKREIKDAQEVTMKNGRPAMKGVCPVCGTAIFRIGSGGSSSSASTPSPASSSTDGESSTKPAKSSSRAKK
jgi:hypothetical protein